MAKNDFSGMQATEIGRVAYGDRGAVVIRVLDIGGGPQIDTRLFFTKGGQSLPSGKGLRLDVQRTRELRALLMRAVTLAERKPGPDAGDEPTPEGGSES